MREILMPCLYRGIYIGTSFVAFEREIIGGDARRGWGEAKKRRRRRVLGRIMEFRRNSWGFNLVECRKSSSRQRGK